MEYRELKLLSLTALLSGLSLIAYAYTQGQTSFFLVFFIPVIRIGGTEGFIGALLIFAGLFLTMLVRTAPVESSRGNQPKSKIRQEGGSAVYGGFVLIGPFPIIFGGKGMGMRAILIAAAAMFLIYLLVIYLIIGA